MTDEQLKAWVTDSKKPEQGEKFENGRQWVIAQGPDFDYKHFLMCLGTEASDPILIELTLLACMHPSKSHGRTIIHEYISR